MGLERPEAPQPDLGEIAGALNGDNVANGLVAFLFAATGPLAILLTVAQGGGLSEREIGSWIAAAYGMGGAMSVFLSLRYRMPLAMAWTIPGAVLAGPVLKHITLPEAVGAYLATGALIWLMGATGWVKRLMSVIPLPIIMGMVAGVFLPLGLGVIRGLGEAPAIAGAALAAFLVVSTRPSLSRVFPPVLAATLAGAGAMALVGGFSPRTSLTLSLARPIFHLPAFSVRSLFELVLPLTVSVIGVQNAQGVAVLTAAGFQPPVNVLTVASGVGSLLFGVFGSVPACVTGPVNAILNSSGDASRRFGGGVVFGLLMIVFGLTAPLATAVALGLPKAFIATLGGLALARVLQAAFAAAFAGRFQLGALVAFVVTVSDISIAHIGAAFWGLVFGFAASWIMERSDFRALLAGRRQGEPA